LLLAPRVKPNRPSYIYIMSANNNWYRVNNPELIDTPALLVFPDRVKHNIDTAIRMVGDISRLRPHIKTNKSPGAVCLMMEAGINKFKCATIAEAEMLGMIWAKDVLLAYQPTGPKLRRFVELIVDYPNTVYSCLTDNMETAKEQATAFSNAGLQVPVYIDINVGMNRTGIAPGPAVVELMKFLSEQRSIKSIGLHAYDGHIRNPDFAGKEKEVNECFSKVERLVKDIEAAGLPKPPVIAGGSPAFSVHCKRDGVECSPGTFVYWDKGYSDLCPEQDFLAAAVLMTRVISLPAPGLVTTDLGHKSVAAENEIGRRVFIMDVEKLKAVSQSEEHLVFQNEGNKIYSPGDILYGLPFHVCPTVALYERVITIENGHQTGEWLNTARDRKIMV
jgi:D-serine deaminase-like pyridoxal phosphate-dependent protein